MDNDNKQNDKECRAEHTNKYMLHGAVFGIVFGAAFGNVTIGIALGPGLGLLLGLVTWQIKRKER